VDSWWRRDDNSTDYKHKKTSIDKLAAAEAEDNSGWLEAGRGGGDRGATVWRTRMAAEETRLTVGSRGATTALTTTTKKQQSTNEPRQRQSTMTAGERRGTVVEEVEQLFGRHWQLERCSGW
jgi:hypothetical protein